MGYRPRQASDSFLSAEVCTTNYDSDLTKTREKTSQRIVDKQDQQKMQYDAKRKAAPEFRVGQRVLVRKVIPANDGKSRKLLQKYSGPYEVLKRLDSDRYVVRDLPGSTRSRRPYECVISVDKPKLYETLTETDESRSDADESDDVLDAARTAE